MPSFAISQFIILLEPLWVSAVFLLLSTGPLLYIIPRYPAHSGYIRHPVPQRTAQGSQPYGSNACPPNGAMGQNLVSIFLGTVYSARGSRRGSMSIILAVHHKHPLYFHNIRSNSQLQLPKMLQRLFASHAHPHRNVGYEADILFLACHQSCQRS